MISHMSHTSVFVLDQDSAKAFYTEKLGFEAALRHHHGRGVRGCRAPASAGSPSGRRTSPTSRSSCPRATWAGRPRRRAAARARAPAARMGVGVMATDDCHRRPTRSSSPRA